MQRKVQRKMRRGAWISLRLSWRGVNAAYAFQVVSTACTTKIFLVTSCMVTNEGIKDDHIGIDSYQRRITSRKAEMPRDRA